MSNYVTFAFDDGTSVLMHVAQPPAAASSAQERPTGRGDLPPGSAGPVPVSRAGDVVHKAVKSLAEVLQPLVPVLESVHEALDKAATKPDEITVELALALSSDLHLMVVDAGTDATLTVSAKWTLKRP